MPGQGMCGGGRGALGAPSGVTGTRPLGAMWAPLRACVYKTRLSSISKSGKSRRCQVGLSWLGCRADIHHKFTIFKYGEIIINNK